MVKLSKKGPDKNEGIEHFRLIMFACGTDKLVILEIRKSPELKTNKPPTTNLIRKTKKTRLKKYADKEDLAISSESL